jgi:hypothetical protein
VAGLSGGVTSYLKANGVQADGLPALSAVWACRLGVEPPGASGSAIIRVRETPYIVKPLKRAKPSEAS